VISPFGIGEAGVRVEDLDEAGFVTRSPHVPASVQRPSLIANRINGYLPAPAKAAIAPCRQRLASRVLASMSSGDIANSASCS
jgi:hypothetical protein